MSYIAFDLDALNVARDVGNACSLPEANVTHGLLRMWAWCFREKTDAVLAEHIRGFFGADACAALVAFGFLSETEDGLRVRGADRYLRVKEAQRRGGLASKSNLKQYKNNNTQSDIVSRRGSRRGSRTTAGVEPEVQPDKTTGSTPALTPNTEHLLKETLPPTETSAGKFPDWQAAVDGVCATFEQERGAKMSPKGRFFKALKAIEEDSGGNLPEVLRRWRIALQSTHPIVGELHEFAERWNKFATDAPKTRPRENFKIIGAEQVVPAW